MTFSFIQTFMDILARKTSLCLGQTITSLNPNTTNAEFFPKSFQISPTSSDTTAAHTIYRMINDPQLALLCSAICLFQFSLQLNLHQVFITITLCAETLYSQKKSGNKLDKAWFWLSKNIFRDQNNISNFQIPKEKRKNKQLKKSKLHL